MKLSVHIKGETLAIPVGDGTITVRAFGSICLERFAQINSGSRSLEDRVAEIRKAKGGALLFEDDAIRDVLDDNDFVNIILETDKDPLLGYNTNEEVAWRPHPPTNNFMTVDGCSLTTTDVMALGKGHFKIKLSSEALKKVLASRKVIDKIVKENKVVYGITTGFGKFADVVIAKEKLVELQENLIRSHCAGVGKPLQPDQVRRFMSLRINVLAKGYSGITQKVLEQFIAAFNANCLPWIPEKGTVGASGDLAPLAHMALGLMGEGKMWSPETGWGEAAEVLKRHNLRPITLGPKEGLALINGTQFITSLGIEALERAQVICDTANAIVALTLEALMGTVKAFDADLHKARPHKGQNKVAGYLRALLPNDKYRSELAESHPPRVQDAYTLRCSPQVHGIVYDTINFVRDIITTEVNSGTDNPMVFADRGEVVSGGNFHGEYPAKVLDYLAIGVHELASMSERRIERLINPAYSELPAFLCADGGVNSGFMIPHCTAAALVSENKVLCHPSSVDSLSTSAGTEDHVSMGGWAARKAVQVVENVEQVLAIELLAACQAMEFRRPLKTTEPLEKVYELVRTVATPWDKDRQANLEMDAVTELVRNGKIWEIVEPYIMEGTA